MDLERIARILYNMSLDMDYADYLETAEAEIQCMVKELQILKDNGCDSTLQALENIAMKNENLEFGKDNMRVTARIDFYVECFDRTFTIETFEDQMEKTEKIIKDAYDLWVENPDDVVGGMCCEEYIINELEENFIVFRVIEEK